MRYYLDTSIVAAYYCNDVISHNIQEIINQSTITSISILTEVELHSAIAKKTRTADLSIIDAKNIIKLFYKQFNDGLYKNIHILNKHYQKACDWLSLFKTNLRTQDALHLAISYYSNQTLITLDKNQANAADILGIKVKYLQNNIN